MGISIDVKVYNKADLLSKLQGWGADNLELNNKILDKCGYTSDDKYILLNNEYYEGYNPYYNIATLFDSAYKKQEDSFDIFLQNGEDGINAVDIEDTAEALGIGLIEED